MLFPLRRKIFSCSVSAFLLVVEVFLSAILTRVSILVLTFYLWSSGEPLFFLRLMLLLYTLNRLIPWRCLLGYLSMGRLLFQFPFSSFVSGLLDDIYNHYYYYYYLIIGVFHISVSWWFFTWVWVTASLLRTLLGILAVPNNVVLWMVSTRPPTSKSSNPFCNPLVTVPTAPITIGIIVTSMFHSFFQFPSKFEVLVLLFTFFQFYSVINRDSKVDNFASSILFVDY